MFKNRFVLITIVLSILLVTVAVSSPLSSTSEFANLSWPPRPVNVPGTGNSQFPDYFLRHTELRSGFTESIDIASDPAPLDECFDVSLSEVAACREASQSPSP